MKHGQNNNRRQRSRGNARRYPNQKGGSFESNGPEAKVRGTAQQIHEKYQSLARDAYSAGDRILAEGYLQHAEHYHRIMNADNEGSGRDNNRGRQGQGQQGQNQNNRDDNRDDSADQNSPSNDREDNRERSDAKDAKDAKEDRDDQQDGEVENGLKRTVSRGRGKKNNGASEDASGAENETADTKSADNENDAAEDNADAPRKPRARRPRKSDKPAAENADQSAAD